MEDDSGISNGGEELVNGGGAGEKNNGAAAATGGKAVQALQRRFTEVQEILERNRVLIQEIGQNHATREPGGLSRNVALIRELNNNIARVVNLYSDLSYSFSSSLAVPKNNPASFAANAPNADVSPAADVANTSFAGNYAAAAKGAYKRPRSTQ